MQDGGAGTGTGTSPTLRDNPSGSAVPGGLLRIGELLRDDEFQVHGGPGERVRREAERVLPQLQHQDRGIGSGTQSVACRGG